MCTFEDCSATPASPAALVGHGSIGQSITIHASFPSLDDATPSRSSPSSIATMYEKHRPDLGIQDVREYQGTARGSVQRYRPEACTSWS
jgi:hypothetical protein